MIADQSWKVLVLGSGAREHALAFYLLRSPNVKDVKVAPGNAGTARLCGNLPLASLQDPKVVGQLVTEYQPDLVVIGPEAPLVAGVADHLRELGVAVVGPEKEASQLEGSKTFFKQFARRHGILTADFWVFDQATEAHAFIEQANRPLVIKADGLCAGKGVVVSENAQQAHQAVDDMLVAKRFGDAGNSIVIEELIVGNEASYHFLIDGNHVVSLPIAQDHKRIFDGDRGPNTGGMGAYAPSPLVDETMRLRLEKEVAEATLRGLQKDGLPFRGVVFAGLMITPAGIPYVLEYNVRFGDPETEVLLPILKEDVAQLLWDTAHGTLGSSRTCLADEYAVTVVLAAAGYPDNPRKGDEIQGLEEAEKMNNINVFHAGTKAEGKLTVTAGGRVLAVGAQAPSLQKAVDEVYRAVDSIQFQGKQMRSDIAYRALVKRDPLRNLCCQ
jgi:phosphoribosylamine---glycine ligase